MNTNTVLIMFYTSEAKETGVNWLGFMSLKSDIHRLHEIPVHSLHELRFSHLWAGNMVCTPAAGLQTQSECSISYPSMDSLSLSFPPFACQHRE